MLCELCPQVSDLFAQIVVYLPESISPIVASLHRRPQIANHCVG
jgi:hypothetical protein